MVTRESIVDAAEKVILEHGVVGATTKEIAREAGCAEGSLYNHFGHKEDLVHAVITERLPPFIEYVHALPERAGQATVKANLEEFATLALSFLARMVSMMGPLLADPKLLERQRAHALARGVGPHRAIEALAQYLRAEQRAGRIGDRANLSAAAMMLMGACLQFNMIRHLVGDEALPMQESRFVRETVKTLLVALDPAPEEAR